MGLHQELPVYKACYDLLLEIFLFTKDFTKEYKYTVGENLIREKISDHSFTTQHIWQTHKASTFTAGNNAKHCPKDISLSIPNLPNELVCPSTLIDKIMKEEF